MKDLFRRFSHRTSELAGSPGAFGLALGFILCWALTGPHFQYSENWQLVVNTATTIITFLMVFLIQNAQNRDSRALHMKLNELIRGTSKARNELIDLESCTEQELDTLQAEYHLLHQHIQQHVERLKAKKESGQNTRR